MRIPLAFLATCVCALHAQASLIPTTTRVDGLHVRMGTSDPTLCCGNDVVEVDTIVPFTLTAQGTVDTASLQWRLDSIDVTERPSGSMGFTYGPSHLVAIYDSPGFDPVVEIQMESTLTTTFAWGALTLPATASAAIDPRYLTAAISLPVDIGVLTSSWTGGQTRSVDLSHWLAWFQLDCHTGTCATTFSMDTAQSASIDLKLVFPPPVDQMRFDTSEYQGGYWEDQALAPEPSAHLLLACGLGLIVLARRWPADPGAGESTPQQSGPARASSPPGRPVDALSPGSGRSPVAPGPGA